ncbi:CAP domain-containing protein [Streptomyces erythrochromogenes]|uniref:CAP domain-containing protein n=1 Tax=Streptomyces erythrochromogenes TaxID=285574 RepID=UPI0036FCACE1
MRATRTSISSLVIALVVATGSAALPFEASQAVAPSPIGSGKTHRDTFCPNDGMVLQPRSAFPNTKIGQVNYNLQSSKMEKAILCLVNWDRRYVRVKPLVTPKLLGRPGRPAPARGLGGAAYDHATAAAQLRWWGTVAQYPSCTPRKDDPGTILNEGTLCDPHINPVTDSTPQERAEAAGFGKGCARSAMAENVYTAYGDASKVTPLAAFTWWLRSDGHRANIRDPRFETMHVKVVLGSADPASGAATPAATFVQMFGMCQR